VFASTRTTLPPEPSETQSVEPDAAIPTGCPPTLTPAGAGCGTTTATRRLTLARPLRESAQAATVCLPGASFRRVLRAQARARCPSTEQRNPRVRGFGAILTSTGESWTGAAETAGGGTLAPPARKAESTSAASMPSG
jgi:hypothetical protein